MKKLLAFLLAILMIPVFTSEIYADEKIWITVCYYDGSGTYHEDDWNNKEKAWNDAIEKSMDSKYRDVTVKIRDDWFADSQSGDFNASRGSGFSYGAIYFPKGCKITVDLEGNSFNRNLDDWEYNGETICVQDGAYVTIKNGTISGGYSCNGGGGIHMKGGSLTLENVNIYSNNTEDDDGAGIFVDAGNLVMKGGTIYSNIARNEYLPVYGGGIVVYGGTAYLEGVEIFGNRAQGGKNDNGGAAAAMGGKLTLNDCLIYDNYTSGSGGALHSNMNGSKLIVENCVIKNNKAENKGGAFYIYEGDVTVKNSNIFGNNAGEADSTAIYHYLKSFRLTNCYVDGTVNDRKNTLVWENRVYEANNLSGTIVNEGNPLIYASVALAAVVLVASVIIIKKKRDNKQTEK